MNLNAFRALEEGSSGIGKEMYRLMEELFPICRSITGNGVRQTLEIIKKHIPIEIHEVTSGTKVYDWTIPKEWNIHDAYIVDPTGEKIANFKKSNLHVLNYSVPINQKISLSELKKHIYTIPDKPELVPYVTSYYSENWGFCMSHNEFLNLKDGEYHAVIDSELDNGSLTYGEHLIVGKSDDEILLSCYVCHPSMCNDNLSGVVLLTMLAKYLQNLESDYSIRFLFVPETIGAITWLYANEKNLGKIRHGLVATCVGDGGGFTYKKSRYDDADIDKTVIKVLENSKLTYSVVDFFPWGSDERQFCSPGFNLPVGSLMRSMYATNSFPEYHTSADNLNFVKANYLAESFSIYSTIISKLEENFSKFQKHIPNYKNDRKPNSEYFQNLFPKCEPQLGRRGIYRLLGGQNDSIEKRKNEFAILWVLNLSDGNHSLSDIVKRSGFDESTIKKAAHILVEKGLLQQVS
jgi:aminopeptidase-like protein